MPGQRKAGGAAASWQTSSAPSSRSADGGKEGKVIRRKGLLPPRVFGEKEPSHATACARRPKIAPLPEGCGPGSQRRNAKRASPQRQTGIVATSKAHWQCPKACFSRDSILRSPISQSHHFPPTCLPFNPLETTKRQIYWPEWRKDKTVGGRDDFALLNRPLNLGFAFSRFDIFSWRIKARPLKGIVHFESLIDGFAGKATIEKKSYLNTMHDKFYFRFQNLIKIF